VRSALVLLAPLVALLEPVLPAGGTLSAVALAGLLGAVASLVLAAVLVVLVLAGLIPSTASALPDEAAETRLLVWLRNPDAAGHVRSRAPGMGRTAV
jgi:hypothetical protein